MLLEVRHPTLFWMVDDFVDTDLVFLSFVISIQETKSWWVLCPSLFPPVSTRDGHIWPWSSATITSYLFYFLFTVLKFYQFEPLVPLSLVQSTSISNRITWFLGVSVGRLVRWCVSLSLCGLSFASSTGRGSLLDSVRIARKLQLSNFYPSTAWAFAGFNQRVPCDFVCAWDHKSISASNSVQAKERDWSKE